MDILCNGISSNSNEKSYPVACNITNVIVMISVCELLICEMNCQYYCNNSCRVTDNIIIITNGMFSIEYIINWIRYILLLLLYGSKLLIQLERVHVYMRNLI